MKKCDQLFEARKFIVYNKISKVQINAGWFWFEFKKLVLTCLNARLTRRSILNHICIHPKIGMWPWKVKILKSFFENSILFSWWWIILIASSQNILTFWTFPMKIIYNLFFHLLIVYDIKIVDERHWDKIVMARKHYNSPYPHNSLLDPSPKEKKRIIPSTWIVSRLEHYIQS